MGDTVAILSDLSFRQQIAELATHIARSLPTTAQDPDAAREYVNSVEASLGVTPRAQAAAEGAEGDDAEAEGAAAAAAQEPEQEVKPETKVEVVKTLVGKVGEARGALEGLKEADVESSHLLLQHVVAATLEGDDYEQAVRSVVEAVRKGAEANLAAGRLARVEVAARILNNTYNVLPPSSALRPVVLLTLLQLLPRFTDLSVLPLTPFQYGAAAAAWSVGADEKRAFLRAVSDLYAAAAQYGTASDIAALPAADSAERSLVLAVCDDKRFEFGTTLTPEAKDTLGAEAKGLLDVLSGDADAPVAQWVGSSGAWIEAHGLPKFTAALITRKAQLISLARVFASAPSRVLSFASIASSLGIPEADVEECVFDGASAGLFVARISQPTATVRVVSLSKTATATASGAAGPGQFEWDLLAKRLADWKTSIAEARKVVGDAETFAAQPIREERPYNAHGDKRQGNKRREKGDKGDKGDAKAEQQQQQQAAPAEAVAA